MRIVWVVPFVPYPPRDGGAIRVYQLVRRLARRHSLRLLVLDDSGTGTGAGTAFASLGVQLEAFAFPKRFPRRWSRSWWRFKAGVLREAGFFYYQPALQERLSALCVSREVDVVILETLKMGVYARCPGFRGMIFSRQNYEPDLARRMAGILPPSRAKLRWWVAGRMGEGGERRTCRRFRFITAVSDRDAGVFRRLVPGAEVAVVPNGVDLERFTPCDEEPEVGLVVLSGLMSYLPNRDSALYFFREIWPRVRRECPGARFAVVGHQAISALPELAGVLGVELREPGSEVVSALRSASVIVVPLRAGAGTRIKVLEGLALGKPVVSTSLGCEGLEVVAGRDVLIADQPQEFARAVIGLLRDPERRRELGLNGRKLVESRYGWEHSAEILEAFCARVAGLCRPSTTE